MRAVIEGTARFINDFLYALFNTVWATTYYFAYWRNWPFVGIIVFGLLVDVIRFNRKLCGRIWSFLFSKRGPLVALSAFVGAGYIFLVIKFDNNDFAFGAARLHYEYAMIHANPLRAVFVFLIETIGVSVGFCALVIYSIRQSAGATLIERRPVKNQSRFQMFLTLTFLLMLIGATFLARVIDFGQPWRMTEPAYNPGQNVLQLILYSATPFFFAAGAKYWLLVVDATFSDNRKVSPRSPD